LCLKNHECEHNSATTDVREKVIEDLESIDFLKKNNVNLEKFYNSQILFS